MEQRHEQARLAVLIDADNAQPTMVQPLLAEVANYGIATVKRAYGDWTTNRLNGWKAALNEYAIQPVQQFGYLASIGVHIANHAPDFDPRNYGYPKLGQLILATDLFEVQERTSKSGQPQKYIRDNRAKKTA